MLFLAQDPHVEEKNKTIETMSVGMDLNNEKTGNTVETENADATNVKLQKFTKEVSKKSESKMNMLNVKSNTNLTHFHIKKIHYVRCKVFFQFPEIVKIFSLNKKTSPITTVDGTKFRENIVNDHFNSVTHLECYTSYTQSLMTPVEKLVKTPMGRYINQANLPLANHVGKLMIHVYGGAKKLTLSANTFPARVFMGSAAENFNFNDFKCGESEYNLQYVTPTSY